MEVTEYEEPKYEEPKCIQFKVRTRLVDIRHTLLLTLVGEGARVEHVLEIRPTGLGILMAPLMGFIMSRVTKGAIAALERRFDGENKNPG